MKTLIIALSLLSSACAMTPAEQAAYFQAANQLTNLSSQLGQINGQYQNTVNNIYQQQAEKEFNQSMLNQYKAEQSELKLINKQLVKLNRKF